MELVEVPSFEPSVLEIPQEGGWLHNRKWVTYHAGRKLTSGYPAGVKEFFPNEYVTVVLWDPVAEAPYQLFIDVKKKELRFRHKLNEPYAVETITYETDGKPATYMRFYLKSAVCEVELSGPMIPRESPLVTPEGLIWDKLTACDAWILDEETQKKHQAYIIFMEIVPWPYISYETESKTITI